MSDNEDLQNAITEITDRTGQAWREHIQDTLNEVGSIQRGLENVDGYISDLAAWVLGTVQTDYGEYATHDIQEGSKFLGAKRAALGEVLEGTTNPDALAALQKLSEAHKASTDILAGVQDTSEAVATSLAAKIEAIRALILLIRSQIYAPFLTSDGVGQIAESYAPSPNNSPLIEARSEVGERIDISFAELEMYKREL